MLLLHKLQLKEFSLTQLKLLDVYHINNQNYPGLNEPNSNAADTQKFEFLLIVRLDENYALKQILELSWEQFLKYKKWFFLEIF